jgi:hypothetical protein
MKYLLAGAIALFAFASVNAACAAFTLAPDALETVHQKITDNIIRLGLNYHF